MILCVTPNPAVDRTLVVPGFKNGAVFRAQASLAAAGGKGLNVGRAVRCLGGEALCMGFLGGTSGRYLSDLAEKEGIPGQWTWIEGETRTCVIMANPENGEATVVNELGPTVTQADWNRLAESVIHVGAKAECVCFSGSLPPRSQVNEFVELVKQVKRFGKYIWIDTSGAALRAVLEVSGIGIKVNGEEAGAILDRIIQTPDEAMEAARSLYQQTNDDIVLTLGPQGAVMATSEGQWWAKPPTLKVIDVVGSGDSFLAGLVTAQLSRAGSANVLQSAVAAGAANALSVGGGHFLQSEFENVRAETTVQTL